MSLSKSEQSRINGAKSQGPVTSEGKTTSSLNSLKHGLYAQRLVLPFENLTAFQELRDGLLAEHHPTTSHQLQLVEQLVAAHWRLLRLRTIESTLFHHQITLLQETIENHGQGDDADMKKRYYHAFAFDELCKSPTLEQLYRHEARLSTQVSRILRTLLRLQTLERPKPAEITPQPPPIQPETTQQPQSPQQLARKRENEPTTPALTLVPNPKTPILTPIPTQNHLQEPHGPAPSAL